MRRRRRVFSATRFASYHDHLSSVMYSNQLSTVNFAQSLIGGYPYPTINCLRCLWTRFINPPPAWDLHSCAHQPPHRCASYSFIPAHSCCKYILADSLYRHNGSSLYRPRLSRRLSWSSACTSSTRAVTCLGGFAFGPWVSPTNMSPLILSFASLRMRQCTRTQQPSV